MPIAWFVCPFKLDIDKPIMASVLPQLTEDQKEEFRRGRYCAMDDFTDSIRGDGGDWAETEVLGNFALVKVRANNPTLNAISSTAGMLRMPNVQLSDPLSTLTVNQATTIRDKLLSLGYTLAEIQAALGTDIRSHTLGDVLRFAATRRRKPRWDSIGKAIVLDGPEIACLSVDIVNAKVV